MTGSDYSHFKNLSGLIQKYIKSDLASAFTSKEIVTAVEIDWHGRINIKKQTWDLYWGAERTLPEQDCFLRF